MPYPSISPAFHVRLLLTNYGEEQVLRKITGVSPVTPPASWYAALGRYNSGAGAAFGESGTGGTEPSAALNYNRAVIPSDNTGWTDPNSNIQATYPSVTTTRVRSWIYPEVVWPEILVAPWDTGGNPRFLGLFDDPDPTEGNCWMQITGNLDTSTPAPVGFQYLIAYSDGVTPPTDVAIVLEDNAFGLSWKIKILDWLLRGTDFTAPDLHLGWVRRNVASDPGEPNTIDETYTEVSTSGTGYSRHDVSGSWDAPAINAFATYSALNTTETWNATADWGFQCRGMLFDGASGPMVAQMPHFLEGFFRPVGGDTVNVGPGVPGTGGCYISCN